MFDDLDALDPAWVLVVMGWVVYGVTHVVIHSGFLGNGAQPR
jgi:hypothetical protein